MTGDPTRLLTDPSYDRKNQTLTLQDIGFLNPSSQQKRKRKDDRPTSGGKASLTEPSVDRDIRRKPDLVRPYEDLKPRRDKELLYQLS